MSLTKRMMGLDDELPEVDPTAFSDPDTCEVDDNWLRAAETDQQLAAMRHWLMARYCDPAMETPHSSEVGYIFTRGGPWHPHDVLMERFEGVADFDTIEELVADILGEIGDELAPPCSRPKKTGMSTSRRPTALFAICGSGCRI